MAREYQKLAGRGRRQGEIFAWNTLWLGRDHILQVEHTGYSEEYKRFYFADIQAISLRLTKRAPNLRNFFLGMTVLALTLMMLLGLGANGNPAWLTFFGLLTALFILLFIINEVKGRSCMCVLQTAVHQEQLPSLKRIKKSHRVLARLREQITQAQGSMAPEEVRARLAGEPVTATEAAPTPEAAPSEPLNPPPAE